MRDVTPSPAAAVETVVLDEALGFAAMAAEDRARRLEARNNVTTGSVKMLLREKFYIVGRMDTACPTGQQWQEAHLVAGLEIPCDSESDALNQLRGMILTLSQIWGPNPMVFVRCEPHTSSLGGYWKASVRLFMIREVFSS